MDALDAILLGVLEGLTEFLPVSSTGHLVLLSTFLGHATEADKTLDVVIQFGAVVAVVAYFRERLANLLRGLLAQDPAAVRLAVSLAVAFMPAAVVGLVLRKVVKERLFGPGPVAVALVVGGVVMIAVELVRRRSPQPETTLEDVTPKRALAVGFAQCFALWPGMSRSMSTIVGGQLAGLSTETAAEFSFLLAIPVLGAATMLDLYKGGAELLEAPGGARTLTIGLGTTVVVSLVVVAAFLKYLKRFGLLPFGVYRIALGALVGWVLTRG
jgi:undecaprenyl-diphosphatase